MGQQIVYCGSCGTSLRQDDFEKGKALEVDAIPYCSKCIPASAASRLAARPGATRSSISSTKIRPVTGPPPGTRRALRGAGGTSTRWILAGAGALLALALLIALLSGGSPAPAPPPSSPPPPSTAAAEAWARLEGFAQAADPDAVLMKCEEAANALRGSAYELKLRALETRTRELKKVRDVERQLARSIEEARKFARSDARFDRPEEFRHLLNRLLAAPGGHTPEIRRILEVWEKELKDLAAAPPPAPPPRPAAGYALGAQGEVRDWLVLGPFPNAPDNGGLYQDRLHTDSAHLPAEGLAVGPVSWTRHSAPDGTVDFRKIPSVGAGDPTAPAVAFAACWLVVDAETKVKFRINADTGCRIRLNAEQIGNMPRDFEIGKDPETYVRTLLRGANLILVKVGTIGAPHRLRFRVTTTPSLTEPAPGVTVRLDPSAPRVVFRETFEGGPGRFRGASLRENALEITTKGSEVEKYTTSPVSAGTTLRFRYKAPAGLKTFCVISWSPGRKLNHWYHFQGLRTDEWTEVSVPLKEMKGGYGMDGPSIEGEVPSNLVFKFDGPSGLTLLIDDVEISE